MLIVSPHLDDAAMSCGATAAAHAEGLKVATVFAGLPPEHVITEYDAKRDVGRSIDRVRQRRAEDFMAWGRLGNVQVYHGDLLDGQYVPDPGRKASEARTIRAWVDSLAWWGREPVLVPLGLGHPDHRFVANAVAAMQPRGATVWAYEELPYKVERPEEVADALERWRARGWDVVPAHFRQAAEDDKVALLHQYRSELGPPRHRHDLLVRERVHKMVRSEA